MHSILFRANALLTFSIMTLAALCTLASFTELLHRAEPSVDIKIAKIERMARMGGGPHAGNDEVGLALDLSVDLTSVFSWNTKQIFLFVCAEYETDLHVRNQVSLWDRIIQRQEDSKFRLPYNRNKYYFVDQGNNLLGKDINLTMYWNVMPITGGLKMGKQTLSGFQLPLEYFRS